MLCILTLGLCFINPKKCSLFFSGLSYFCFFPLPFLLSSVLAFPLFTFPFLPFLCFSFLSFPVVFLSFLSTKARLSHRGLDVQVGLQHVPDQDPNSISVTLLSSPVQAQPLLLVLHPNVAAQGHQLGHHCGVTPQAGPHEDVPPIAALVLNGQPQRSQQLNQLQITRPCIIGSEFANVPTIAAQVYRREVSSSASSKSPNPASVQCRCQRPTHSSLGREWTTPEKPAAGPAPNHQNLCHVL